MRAALFKGICMIRVIPAKRTCVPREVFTIPYYIFYFTPLTLRALAEARAEDGGITREFYFILPIYPAT